MAAADNRAVAEAAFDELVRQDFTALAARFSPQMKAALPPEKLGAQIGPVIANFGAMLHPPGFAGQVLRLTNRGDACHVAGDGCHDSGKASGK